jgi:hypothetical protein
VHLRPETPERELAQPVDDAVDLAFARVDGLRGDHDEEAQEVRMAVELGTGCWSRRSSTGSKHATPDEPAGRPGA